MSQIDDCLLPVWWCSSVRTIAAAPSKLYSGGFFFISRWARVLHNNTHTNKVHWHWFPSAVKNLFLSPVGRKHFPYVTIPASAAAVSTDHAGVLFVFSVVNSAAGMAPKSLGLQHCLSIALWIAAAAQGSLQGCTNSPGEQLSKLVKCIIVKPVVQLSTLSHISALNQTSPVLIHAGEFLESLGNKWLSALGVHAGKFLLSLNYCARSIFIFFNQTYKLNPVTLAIVDIFGKQSFGIRIEIGIWVFCQTEPAKLLMQKKIK